MKTNIYKTFAVIAALAIVLMTLLAAQAGQSSQPTCELKTENGQAVPLYQQPSSDSPQAGWLYDGQTVTLLESSGDWRHVRTNEDLEGWVNAPQWCQ